MTGGNLPLADDGIAAAVVGPWAKEKHERLVRYIGITRIARKKYLGPGKAGATYIDPFCSTGRALIRNTHEFIDGSPVAAWKAAAEWSSSFSEVHIGDLDQGCLEACTARLNKLSVPVQSYHGPAEDTVERISRNLNPYGLHFAFLDPFNLGALPLDIIRCLSRHKRMDMLIHVSSQDLQRNFREYLDMDDSPLDRFAPGWRKVVQASANQRVQRRQVFEHWLELIRGLGLAPADGIEHVTGGRKQTLYWLVLVARHELALKFWDQARQIGNQGQLL